MTNLHWFCKPCNSGARKLLVNFIKLNERICQVQMEQKIAKVDCAKLNERVEKIEIFTERVEMENLNERKSAEIGMYDSVPRRGYRESTCKH